MKKFAWLVFVIFSVVFVSMLPSGVSPFAGGDGSSLLTNSFHGGAQTSSTIECNVTTLSAGCIHTVGLKEDGTVVAVGYNGYGALNVSGWSKIKSISAGYIHTVGLKEDGTVVAVGDNEGGQLNVSGWANIKSISAGGYHTVGLKENGTVVAVGSNGYGQLNVSGWANIKAISAGQFHTVGLKEDGTVVAVGYNGFGGLNVSGWTNIKAISAGFETYTIGLKEDGTVVGAGPNWHGELNVSGWTNIKSISAGADHTVGLKEDGKIVAVGDNEYLQLNVSGWTNIRQPCHLPTDNTPPVLASIGNKLVIVGQSLSFTISATDPEGDPLTYSASGLPTGATFDTATRTFSWTPGYGQTGSYNVSFAVSDGALADSETIIITVANVNQTPVLAPIGNMSVNEGQSLSFTISATDPDGNILTYSATGLPSGASFNASTRTFSWTPKYNQAGNYNVSFSVSDGALTDSEAIIITVTNVNQPQLSFGRSIILQDHRHDGVGYGGFGLIAADFNKDRKPDIAASFSTGTLSSLDSFYDVFIGNGTDSSSEPFTSGKISDCYGYGANAADFNRDGNLDLVFVFGGSTAECYGDRGIVLLGDGTGHFDWPGHVIYGGNSVCYTGIGDFNGDGKIDLVTDDDGGILISWGNGDGTFSPGTYLHCGYDARDIAVLDFDNNGKLDIVHACMSPNVIRAYSGNGSGGFFLTADIAMPAIPIGITYRDFNKDGKIDLAISDYIGQVTLLIGDGSGGFYPQPSVMAVQGHAGTIVSADFDRDGNLDIGVTNWPDPNGIISVLLGDGLGNLSTPIYFPLGPDTYLPSMNQVDFDNDGLVDLVVGTYKGITVLFNTTLTNVNQPPVLASIGNSAVNEGQSLSFPISATDPDSDTLTYSATGLPSGAGFDASTFSWTPGYSQAGSYPVTFAVTDGTLTDSEAVIITVTNVNQPPVLAFIGNKSVDEGQSLSFPISASDPDSDTLTYSATGLPSGAGFDASTFSWTPGYDKAGSYNVTFTVTDGTLTDFETISITVTNVNTPPGTNVLVTPDPNVTISFNQVTGTGNTTVTVSNTNPGSEKTDFKFLGAYYDISTTATYSGPLTICLKYDDSNIPPGKVKTLKIFHWDSAHWINVTSSLYTVNNIICAQVFSLSWFAIAYDLDDIAPTTNISLSGTLGNNGWYVSNVQVALTAADNEGGSGVAKTEYSFDGIAWISYLSPFMVSTEGTTTVYHRSTDSAGNVEENKTEAIKIDKTLPVPDVQILLDLSGECSVENINIPTATDNCDGKIAATTADPLEYKTQGTYLITWIYRDKAGNLTMQKQTITVHDITAPAISASDPVCVTVGNGNKKSNKITVTAQDNCSKNLTLQIMKVEVFNNGGNLVQGNGIYEISGNTVYVNPSGNGWSVRITVIAADDNGNTTQPIQITKSLIKC